MIEYKELIDLSAQIDNLLMDSCVKHQVSFDVITAIVLARIVAISQQINTESDTSHLLSMAQCSIMDSENQILQ